MQSQVRVDVHAVDPILRAGVVSHLRPRSEVRVLTPDDTEHAAVAIVVADRVNDDTIRQLRRARRDDGSTATVLVVGDIDDSELVDVVEAGVVAVLRRPEATADRLVAAIVGAARKEGTVPPDLLGRLLDQVGALQRGVLGPRGIAFNGLAAREIEVLRLVADGCDTSEIATRLAYSERTVKNVLHDITTRLQLRNRSHAVAYALRQGFI
ncbi:response regulator transcription factor [Nocardioides albidus]|uniref:Response regulator transcription factor n=1 Tax=Nocardioides albidus TaxID=1517589 RepID=A0A5C4VUU9_9ACTN|nr:LuxR C-terminal-related transcriptional regulator [Nocardioides albidus]TNM39692.1 response regulator transcription factor [Nocardioides albidus]